ncbi:F-box only protein 32-like isoform X2 [Conger conger]|uniref:F-box only protein 32-like isoform X2 n=1 Tax=Conger conger TaxID=82655 RepID=UPI002A5A32E6|nr:F-box only protein 32-like isoform X2 [Conger conger]
MPFLGQDWRSPGQNWVKTKEGWKKQSDYENKIVAEFKSCCKDEEFHNGNVHLTVSHELAAKKRSKELMNDNTKVPYFHRDKWIYVHKGTTKERHGYCTLGEAFNRLDFSNAIMDSRRFSYVVKLLELIAKTQLTSLSGVAQENYMNILEKVLQKVLEDQQSLRNIRELLQTLYVSVGGLVQGVGRFALVGNVNIWTQRMDTIQHWQQQLRCIQIRRPVSKGMTLTDLPACLQLRIMQCLSDERDLLSLGQVCPDLHTLTEDCVLWKKLCQYHYTDRQIHKHLLLSERGQLEWKRMYYKLCCCFPHEEQYSDTPQFCTHCYILFWKDTNHPCTANNSDSCCIPVSPQGFLRLFQY